MVENQGVDSVTEIVGNNVVDNCFCFGGAATMCLTFVFAFAVCFASGFAFVFTCIWGFSGATACRFHHLLFND